MNLNLTNTFSENSSPKLNEPFERKTSTFNEGSTITSEALNIDHARGVHLWDLTGKRYLDLFSQTWSMPLGHNNSKVIGAVKKQLSKITHLRTAYSTPEKIELINKI